jgi:hypothetical protein
VNSEKKANDGPQYTKEEKIRGGFVPWSPRECLISDEEWSKFCDEWVINGCPGVLDTPLACRDRVAKIIGSLNESCI